MFLSTETFSKKWGGGGLSRLFFVYENFINKLSYTIPIGIINYRMKTEFIDEIEIDSQEIGESCIF